MNSELSETNQENIELKVILRQEDENEVSCSSQGNLTELELLSNHSNVPSEQEITERTKQVKNVPSRIRTSIKNVLVWSFVFIFVLIVMGVEIGPTIYDLYRAFTTAKETYKKVIAGVLISISLFLLVLWNL